MTKLRVWWSSQVPIVGDAERYDVKDIEEAKNKINELAQRDLKDPNVTDNVGGLEYFDENEKEWFEWCSDDGDDIMEVMRND